MVEVPISSLRGKWAQGIKPRSFMWIIKDKLAVCERIGGRGENHRPVRRQEEIVWIMNSSIDVTISIMPGNHNIAAYEELKLNHRHWPITDVDEAVVVMPQVFEHIDVLIASGRRLLIHRNTLDDTLAGLIGGFLYWGHYLDDPTSTIIMTERLFGRQLGPRGRTAIRELAAASARKGLPRPPEAAGGHPIEDEESEQADAEAADSAEETNGEAAASPKAKDGAAAKTGKAKK